MSSAGQFTFMNVRFSQHQSLAVEMKLNIIGLWGKVFQLFPLLLATFLAVIKVSLFFFFLSFFVIWKKNSTDLLHFFVIFEGEKFQGQEI